MSNVLTIGLRYDARNATPRTLTDNDLKGIVANAGWRSGKPFQESQQVVIAESGKRTAVTSSNPAGGINVGIFQIWSGNVPANQVEYLKDPTFNANVARRIYLRDGATFKKSWETAANGKAFDTPAPALGNDAQETTVAGAASDVVDATKVGLADFLTAIQSREFWQRVGLVIIGGILVTGAVLVLASEFMSKVPTPIKAAIR